MRPIPLVRLPGPAREALGDDQASDRRHLGVGGVERVADHLQAIVAEKQVGLILVGLPRNMDGTYGPAAQKVQAFIATRSTTYVPSRSRRPSGTRTSVPAESGCSLR